MNESKTPLTEDLAADFIEGRSKIADVFGEYLKLELQLAAMTKERDRALDALNKANAAIGSTATECGLIISKLQDENRELREVVAKFIFLYREETLGCSCEDCQNMRKAKSLLKTERK